MLPIVAPTNFLASCLTSGVVLREQELLSQLAAAEPMDAFTITDQLRTLYVRNVRSGGIEGRKWLDQAQEAAVRQIREDNLFPDFLRIDPEGRTWIHFPRHLGLPLALKLSEEMSTASIIFIPPENALVTGALAYFRIEDLTLGQDILSDKKLAFFKGFVDLHLPFLPTVVARDLHGRGHHLHDGHHRSCAALQRGHRYILAKMNREAKVHGLKITFGDMKILPHDEFERRIASFGLQTFTDAPIEAPAKTPDLSD